LIKYGIDNFKWEVVFECDNEELLNYMEYFWIFSYKNYLYNLKTKIERIHAGKPLKLTEETKQKMSKSMILSHKKRNFEKIYGHWTVK